MAVEQEVALSGVVRTLRVRVDLALKAGIMRRGEELGGESVSVAASLVGGSIVCLPLHVLFG